MRQYTPDPRLYEMMTILSPDVSEEDLPAHIETIAGYITTAGGSVNETLRESPWGRRRLAYSIRHDGRDIRDGFYTVFHFTLDPSGVRDIERDLKLNDQVMRFLITHFTPRAEVPGAAPEGGDAVPADGEAAAAVEAAPVESAAPTETAAAAEAETEPTPVAEAAEAVDEAPDEAVEAVADAAATAETADTEAAAATTEPAEVDPAAVEAAPAEEAVADTAVAEDAGAVEEAPSAKAAAEETGAEVTPAEPAAPAKDDEEA